MKIPNKKFIYLISPNKILNNDFFNWLDKVLRSNKVSFFQLRLKNEGRLKKIKIAKKAQKICKKYKVKFLINDDPYLALELGADGCHLGQKDMNILEAQKILKGKIIGVTCHNSIRLAKKASNHMATYIALGAFNKSRTKKVAFRANLTILRKIRKVIKIPIVAIGGINEKNYQNLLLNKANFLAISSYIWKNKNYKPDQAIKNLK